VFDNPLAVIFDDEAHSEEEERELIIGHSADGELLVVVFTEQVDGVVRIISARRATKLKLLDDIRDAAAFIAALSIYRTANVVLTFNTTIAIMPGPKLRNYELFAIVVRTEKSASCPCLT